MLCESLLRLCGAKGCLMLSVECRRSGFRRAMADVQSDVCVCVCEMLSPLSLSWICCLSTFKVIHQPPGCSATSPHVSETSRSAQAADEIWARDLFKGLSCHVWVGKSHSSHSTVHCVSVINIQCQWRECEGVRVCAELSSLNFLVFSQISILL